VFNSLVGSGVIVQGTCSPPAVSGPTSGLTWTYTISGCSTVYPNNNLVITINRGWVCSSGPSCSTAPPAAVGAVVTVSYPYNWRFNSVIQLLIPGAAYAAVTNVTEAATVHTQM
jgi:hypothetical protein